jgi:hypothetical protein
MSAESLTVIELDGQCVAGDRVPLHFSNISDQAQIEATDLSFLESAMNTDSGNLLQIVNSGSLSVPGDIGGPGNQGIPRGYSDRYTEIGGPQGAPRGVAALTVSSIPESYYDEYN